MLDEKIERCNEIGDIYGIRFLCRCLSLGIVAKDSLNQLRLNHIGHISINIDIAILLLSKLEEEYSRQYDELLKSSQEESIDTFKEIFSNILVSYLVVNDVIRWDVIRYDELSDKFYIPQHGFKLKHFCYRNLLMSAGVIAIRDDGGYYYYGNVSAVKKETKKKKYKVTLAQLESNLQQQREDGELGEKFVLKYELTRLKTHPNKEQIRQISAIDVSAGYDIVSFENEYSEKIDRFIEVKTYHKKPHFYWSRNEQDEAKLKGDKYFIYLVDADQIDDYNYNPFIIKNPISFFDNNIDWESEIETLHIEKI